jgi:hypothetical protein
MLDVECLLARSGSGSIRQLEEIPSIDYPQR